MYLIVLKQLGVMAVIALAGFAAAKAFGFGKKEQTFVSKLLLYVINPCLILHTFDQPFDKDRFKELLVVIAVSVAAHLLLMLLAVLTCRSRTEEGKKLDALDKISVVFTNCGFIGIPLINGIFGQGGTFYLMGYIAVFNICLWTLGYYIISGKVKLAKVVTNPNVLAVLLGMIIFCIPYRLPDFIASPLTYIGEMNTATSMILLGMLFANFSRGETPLSNYVLRLVKVCSLRLVASFFVMLFVCWAASRLFSGMQNIHLMTFVVFIASLCPVGMSVSSLAVIFDRDESYASMIVALTSALCLLTLPLSVAIAERLF